MATIPLSLYVHIPWCVRKCPYCDFNSHEIREQPDEQAYVSKLLADLSQDLPLANGRQLSSIFIGGGTPSVFQADSIAMLIEGIRQRIPLTPDCEITLEANPGTFEHGRYHGYCEAGINRLSMGIQSFDDKHLTKLGRIHSSSNAIEAITQAKKEKLRSFNLDLMFGLPEQTIEQALADLATALTFEPKHLSWYQLTLEPNTAFYHDPPPLPKDEQIWDMQEQGQALLAQHGLAQYEVSAYSAAGFASQHNLNYWQFGDYLGIGAGAHSKLTNANHSVQRIHKHRHPKKYQSSNNSFIAGRRILNSTDKIYEFMLYALRLKSGVASSTFEHTTGLPLTSLATLWQQGVNDGLLQPMANRLVTTATGFNFLNDAINLFNTSQD